MKRDFLFGIDLGGTTIKMGILHDNGKIFQKWEIPTRIENQGDNIIPDIINSFTSKIAENGLVTEQFIGCGIGVPAPVKSGSGHFPKAVNLGGFGDVNISTILEEKLQMPSFAGNDANVAAFGESWTGSARGMKNLVMVTLGTGVGGGIIVDGNIVFGANGAGGEIGHMQVCDQDSKFYSACNCGASGCLETVASAQGIVKLYNILKDEFPESSLYELEYVTSENIFNASICGDRLAREVTNVFSSYLAHAIKLISAVTNPKTIVLGGGVSNAKQYLIDLVSDKINQNVFPILTNDLELTIAKLGNDAGIVGAAYLAMQNSEFGYAQ